MNNLHRELAPISDAAWSQIEEETSRTIKRYLAGRRVVDVQGPGGLPLSAVGTGHLRNVAAPANGILARQREVKPLVELRVPFELDRQQIDDVERGANDSDWQPAKDAARLLAFAEDRAIFEGYAAAGIGGIREGTSNPILTLPADIRAYHIFDPSNHLFVRYSYNGVTTFTPPCFRRSTASSPAAADRSRAATRQRRTILAPTILRSSHRRSSATSVPATSA